MKNRLLINQALPILFMRPTHPVFVKAHDNCMADTSPYPLLAKSLLLEDLGFVDFLLDGATHETPHKKP